MAVQLEERWLLHAGDAYYDHRELTREGKPLAGLGMLQRMVHNDYKQAIENQRRLHALNLERKEIDIFCAHDSSEFHQSKQTF